MTNIFLIFIVYGYVYVIHRQVYISALTIWDSWGPVVQWLLPLLPFTGHQRIPTWINFFFTSFTPLYNFNGQFIPTFYYPDKQIYKLYKVCKLFDEISRKVWYETLQFLICRLWRRTENWWGNNPVGYKIGECLEHGLFYYVNLSTWLVHILLFLFF